MSGASGGRGLMTSWQLAVAQHLGARHAGGDHPQFQPRRLCAQAAQQGRQQQVALQVVGGKGDGGLQPRRVETGRQADKTAHLFQQRAGALRQQRRHARWPRCPARTCTNSGSPTMPRSLSSRWLTADWVTPRRCAARVTSLLFMHRHQQQQVPAGGPSRCPVGRVIDRTAHGSFQSKRLFQNDDAANTGDPPVRCRLIFGMG
jgi:hypothetical protein